VLPLKMFQSVKFSHLYSLFYYNFLTVSIMRVGMLKELILTLVSTVPSY